MEMVIIEAQDDRRINWGKFMIIRFGEREFEVASKVIGDGGPSLLTARRWCPGDFWLMDLETREGAAFRPGIDPAAQMALHRIWVCLLYEPLLMWLFQQDMSDLSRLPKLVTLSGVVTGYRKARLPGPERDPYQLHREIYG